MNITHVGGTPEIRPFAEPGQELAENALFLGGYIVGIWNETQAIKHANGLNDLIVGLKQKYQWSDKKAQDKVEFERVGRLFHLKHTVGYQTRVWKIDANQLNKMVNDLIHLNFSD